MENKTKVMLPTDKDYKFFLHDTASQVRFKIHIYNFSGELTTNNSTCFGDNNGSVELSINDHGQGSTVNIFNEHNDMIFTDFSATGKVKMQNLPPGNYRFEVSSNAFTCSSQSQIFTIQEPGEMKAHFDFADKVLSFKTDQEINFENKSQGTIKSFEWNFGDGNTSSLTNPRHIFESAGIHEVNLIAKNGNDDCDVSFSRTIEVADKYLSVDQASVAQGEVKVYTNDQQLNISFDEAQKIDVKFEVIDLQGKTVLKDQIDRGNISFSTHVQELPKTFIVRFARDSGFESVKVMK